jgi:hypothetical protein
MTEFEKMGPEQRQHIIRTLREVGAESPAERAALLNTAANGLEQYGGDISPTDDLKAQLDRLVAAGAPGLQDLPHVNPRYWLQVDGDTALWEPSELWTWVETVLLVAWARHEVRSAGAYLLVAHDYTSLVILDGAEFQAYEPYTPGDPVSEALAVCKVVWAWWEGRKHG